jgi:hypothetical protein
MSYIIVVTKQIKCGLLMMPRPLPNVNISGSGGTCYQLAVPSMAIVRMGKKSFLIVKECYLDEATHLFDGTGITITIPLEQDILELL